MIITEYIKVVGNSRNITHYRSLGYEITPKEEINVLVEHLPKGSDIFVEVICDNCSDIKNVRYNSYYKITKSLQEKYFCNKCSSIKIKSIFQDKYGCHPSKLNSFKDKVKKTSIEKYGKEHYSKLDSVKQSKKDKSVIRYGVSNPSQSQIIKDKKIETSVKNWGVSHPMKNSLIKEKNIKAHGENYIPYFTKVENLASIIAKKKDLLFVKYDKILNLDKNEYEIKTIEDSILSIHHKECGNIFDINFQNVRNRISYKTTICTHCYPISEQKSIKEKEISDWLSEFININVVDRFVLGGKELDIYIPSKKIGIEMNGLYWHSELFKDKNYHLSKSLKCSELDIQLLHIWEDEWVFKQDIVKSIIKNRLGIIDNKIYARHCIIKEVDDVVLVKDFLNNNHIQGYCQSSIKLGLYYKNELVSLMTFGKRLIKKNMELELIRFCNLLNVNVIGAASKLFNYFISNYAFDYLISYSDFRLFDGSLYQKLGFSKQYLSQPDYFWCKGLERKHRFNFNKQKLIREGYDSNKTEVEIMHSRGYYRIYGCGQYRWIFKKS